MSSRTLPWIYVALYLFYIACQAYSDPRPPLGSLFGIPGDAVFDFVVVGGGTAGLTVARKLALDGRYRVAVIEAGSLHELDNGNRSQVPGLGIMEPPSSPVDWQFTTVSQAGVDNRTLPCPRGRCLGGTSARNMLVYQRPTKGAMDMWAKDVGDESWNWDNMSSLYGKTCRITQPSVEFRAKNATPQYSSDQCENGALSIGFSSYVSPVASYFLEAFETSGSPIRQHGFTDGDLVGSGFLPSTLDGTSQERTTSASSLFDEAELLESLTVYTNTMAKRLIFEGKTVSGVAVETKGKRWRLTARKEVILSAGAIQSPQLLLVSGIGPKTTLEAYKIPVVIDLPGVGENMMDHFGFSISIPVDVETASTYLNNAEKKQAAVMQYNTKRSGFLTSPGVDVLSFEQVQNNPDYELSSKASEGLSWVSQDWPEVEFWQFSSWFGPFLGSPAPTKSNYASLLAVLIAPLSRGYVTINSSDMSDKPIINPNWLHHTVDQELAIATFKRARKIINQPALRRIAGPEAYPGEGVKTDAEILANIRTQGMSIFHAAGTCRMGKEGDLTSVVGPDYRVHGLRNLRVVDLSAIPFLPPGQPQATVYVLAEKAALEILRLSSSKHTHIPKQDHDEL